MTTKDPTPPLQAEPPADELELLYQDAWGQRQRAERLFQGEDWVDEGDELDE